MKRLLTLLAAVLLAASGTFAAAPAQAHNPYCGIRWGSLEKAASGTANGSVSGVRAGRHRCYDRLVIDVAGKVSGYTVRYSDSDEMGIFDGQSSAGEPLRGGKLLSIRVELATTDAAGDATFDPRWHYNHELVDVSRFRTFRQVAGGWGYQGYAILGIGTRARLPFRVFTLDGPGSGSRLVIDVAHKW
ncbi:AMIN-like domain-containing (lipo)protein [Cellulomonas soli]